MPSLMNYRFLRHPILYHLQFFQKIRPLVSQLMLWRTPAGYASRLKENSSYFFLAICRSFVILVTKG